MLKLSAISLLLLSSFAFTTLSPNKTQGGVIESEKLSFEVDTVVSGIKTPWAIAFLSSSEMLFTERGGKLRLYKDGKLHSEPIAGLPEIKVKGQGGLFDLELHPNYQENGWIYISYSSPAKKDEAGEGANTELIRARIKNHTLVDQEVIFKASPNYKANHHFGGRIEFDREGYLYLTVGDRGGRDEVQNLANFRGKVFRLKDDGSIPKDNPFLYKGDANPAAFTYGHRNPQGMAMHPETGEIWTNEHGPQGGDEVNIIRKGNNYGWPTITYGINYNNTIITEDTVMEGMEQPILFWRPSIAPSGMEFISSDRYGSWKGNLLVGSMKFRYLNRCELDGDKIVHQEKLLENMGRVRAVKQSPDGYIYVAIEGPGMIVRLRPE